jgi:hypothetical protein
MTNNASMKTPVSPLTDAAFEEWFEATDVGSLLADVEPQIVSPAPKRMGRPRIGKKITLTLPEDTIEDLRARGAKLGLGYQTYARMILMGLSKDETAG